MRNLVFRTLLVACTLALLSPLGSSLASAADGITGRKYSDAASNISARNGTAVVATVSGSALPLDDCVVTSWAQSIFLDSNGDNRRSKEYRLNLNCNNPVATPGHPGNSAVTPEGAKAKKDQADAAKINKDPAGCRRTEKLLNYCINLCKRTGLCEMEA